MNDEKIEMTVPIPEDMMKKLEIIAQKQGCTVENLVQGLDGRLRAAVEGAGRIVMRPYPLAT